MKAKLFNDFHGQCLEFSTCLDLNWWDLCGRYNMNDKDDFFTIYERFYFKTENKVIIDNYKMIIFVINNIDDINDNVHIPLISKEKAESILLEICNAFSLEAREKEYNYEEVL